MITAEDGSELSSSSELAIRDFFLSYQVCGEPRKKYTWIDGYLYYAYPVHPHPPKPAWSCGQAASIKPHPACRPCTSETSYATAKQSRKCHFQEKAMCFETYEALSSSLPMKKQFVLCFPYHLKQWHTKENKSMKPSSFSKMFWSLILQILIYEVMLLNLAKPVYRLCRWWRIYRLSCKPIL